MNFYTPEEKCSVHYNDIDYVIEDSLFWKHEMGADMIVYAKTDLLSVFRILPLKPHCICWLLMKAINPTDGETYYCVEKNLPFGSSISCSHFQRFSNALRHIFEYKAGQTRICTN